MAAFSRYAPCPASIDPPSGRWFPRVVRHAPVQACANNFGRQIVNDKVSRPLSTIKGYSCPHKKGVDVLLKVH